MVNWKLGLFRSWIVATGYWVVSLLLYGLFSGELFEHYGDLDENALAGMIFSMVAGPILLLLLGLSVVWATRGFVKE